MLLPEDEVRPSRASITAPATPTTRKTENKEVSQR